MSVDRLRRLIAATAAGRLLSSSDAAWLVAGGQCYLAKAPDGMSLDRALGVAPVAGAPSWWASEARVRRDQALRSVRAEFMRDVHVTVAATEIVEAMKRHRAVRGDSDQARRLAAARPAIRRRIEELIGPVDTVASTRQVRRILSKRENRGQMLPEAMAKSTSHTAYPCPRPNATLPSGSMISCS